MRPTTARAAAQLGLHLDQLGVDGALPVARLAVQAAGENPKDPVGELATRLKARRTRLGDGHTPDSVAAACVAFLIDQPPEPPGPPGPVGWVRSRPCGGWDNRPEVGAETTLTALGPEVMPPDRLDLFREGVRADIPIVPIDIVGPGSL